MFKCNFCCIRSQCIDSFCVNGECQGFYLDKSALASFRAAHPSPDDEFERPFFTHNGKVYYV